MAEKPCSLPGGDYTATQNPDGTWNVLDVPVFVEHTIPLLGKDDKPLTDADGKPREFAVDAAWMEKAAAKARARFEQDAYLPPLHVEHKADGSRTELAGRYKVRRVGPGYYEGQPRAMTYVDLICIPDAQYQEIRAGRLPYKFTT